MPTTIQNYCEGVQNRAILFFCIIPNLMAGLWYRSGPDSSHSDTPKQVSGYKGCIKKP